MNTGDKVGNLGGLLDSALGRSGHESEHDDITSYESSPQPEVNSFLYVKSHESAEIYSELTQGKVIGKVRYDALNSRIIDNKMFTIIYNNEDHFIELYNHIGFKLVMDNSGEFYYIKSVSDKEDDNDANKSSFRIMVPLIILSYYYLRSGRSLNSLKDIDIGLDSSDIDEIKSNDKWNAILSTAKIKDWDEAMRLLSSRGFAWTISVGRWVLSPAGMTLLNNAVKNYESDKPQEF